MGMWWLNVVLDLFSVNPKYSKDKFHFWLGKSSKVFMRGFGSTSHLIYMYRWTNLISVWYLLSFDILLISMWFAIPGDFYHHSNPYAPCMEYLPTFTLKITQFCRKIYQHHGSHMGFGASIWSLWLFGWTIRGWPKHAELQKGTQSDCCKVDWSSSDWNRSEIGDSSFPDAPWCWNIYLHFHLPQKWHKCR